MEVDPSAELVTLSDRSGCKYEVIKYDGMYFAAQHKNPYIHENIIKLHGLNVRHDDILILGYKKSGTHWIYEMIGMLLNGTTETISEIEEVFMLDLNPVEKINNLPSPRILNSHFWPKHLPLELVSKCKLVYLLRNPKDIAVSKYHHTCKLLSGTHAPKFNDFLDLFLESKVVYGSWFGYVRAFEDFFQEHSELNPLIINYEETKQDPLRTVKTLAEHLNVTYPDDFLKKVADECHIDKMRVNNETKRNDFTTDRSVDGKSAMYRKGEVGDWKHWFTVAESEKFDLVFKEKMAGSKLKFTFEL